ncbi:MAG: asparagine synthase (glutamine-hydrolyzing) [Bryobacteraceae bacterium]
MCGIAGFLMRGGMSADPERARAMAASLVHRGPDGEGFFVEEGAALAHRRLSIIDLEGGTQPMHNEDGSLCIVFNGEIYNFLELRPELERAGHVFRTRSDTEVLLHLYEELGEAMTERLNGMFAFAIWDRRKRELFLARDRFGKKPLYYLENQGPYRFAFASEAKALLALPETGRTPDAACVADFLAFGYVPEPRSIYRGIRKLPAGSWLRVSEAGLYERRYWRLEFGETEQRWDEAAAQIDRLASDAVRLRLVSDVPLGAFLSGGVDSSAVVAYMARHAPGRVRTFSIGFDERDYDETRYARMIAERYRTDHCEQIVRPQIGEMLDVLVHHFDEPFGDASAIPSLYLARMTRQHVTVALSGDGADEIFAGYRRYRHALIEERIRRKFPDWFRRTFFRAAGKIYPKFDYLPQVFRAKSMLANLSCDLADAYFNSLTVFRDAELDRILHPDLRRALAGHDARAEYRERFLRYRELAPLEQLQAVDVETYLPGDILVKADRATMAWSLEGRSPWLDYRLAELAARLPCGWKVSGGNGKFIFKKTVEPLAPGEILWRPKMGFVMPLKEWFRGELRPVFEREVLEGADAGLIDRQEAARLLRQHVSGVRNRDRWLWHLLVLQLWARRWAGL